MTPAAAERPLRFCMVTTFYPPYHFGGDALFVYRLAESLAARGHRVDVVHSVDAYHLNRQQEPDVAFAHHPGVARHELRSASPRLAALAAHQLGAPAAYGRRLASVLEAARPDVIHFHNVSLVGGPGVLRLGNAVKLYTAHEYWLVCPTHVLFKFDREACRERECLACTLQARRPPQAWRHGDALARAARHVDRFLMPSRFALEKHRELGLQGELLHLPHFVPDRPAGSAPPSAAARPYFLYVGRLEKLKGVQDLVAAFRRYDGAELLIAGSGSQEPELRAAASGLPHVRFLGQLHPDALDGLYAGAVAMLAPSLCYETFGLTVAESLQRGTPAIARRIGALAEMIDETGGGLTFSTEEELLAAMERLRTDATLRGQLSEAGRASVARLYGADAHVGRYLDIVRALLPLRSEACAALAT